MDLEIEQGEMWYRFTLMYFSSLIKKKKNRVVYGKDRHYVDGKAGG